MLRKQIITDYKYEFRSSEPENVAILYLFSKNKLISMALFTAEDYLPPPREGMNGIIYLAYRCDWLHRMIDILEKDKAVYFVWDDELMIAKISTENDDVSEEEQRSLFRYVFGDNYKNNNN